MKIKKIIIAFIFYSCSSLHCSAQCENICGILDALFKEKMVLKYLSIYNKKFPVEYGKLSVVLIDTLNYFGDCTPRDVHGLPLIVADKYHRNNSGDRYASRKGANIATFHTFVDVFSLKRVEGFYILDFGRLENGLYGHIILKHKKRKFIIIAMQLGQT